MPRNKLDFNFVPKHKYTQCDRNLEDAFNLKPTLHLKKTLHEKEKEQISVQCQTEIIGSAVSPVDWDILNVWKQKNNKKRVIEILVIDKETTTDDLEVPIQKIPKISNIPAVLSELQEYIFINNDKLCHLELIYIFKKDSNGYIDQLEITSPSCSVSMSSYNDTPVRILFSSHGILTILRVFKKEEEISFLDPCDQSLLVNVIDQALNLLSMKHVFCPGISKDECANTNTKNLMHISSPYERYQSINCYVWYLPPKNASKAKLQHRIYQCENCSSLSWYIKDQKKKKSKISPAAELMHLYPHSSCPFSSLTPEDQKKRLQQNRSLRFRQQERIKKLEKILRDNKIDF